MRNDSAMYDVGEIHVMKYSVLFVRATCVLHACLCAWVCAWVCACANES